MCHGDLKWENVLLKTEAQDPDGCLAKIADFGLSRALAFGQVSGAASLHAQSLAVHAVAQ